jgi:hypothetical protein
MAHVLNNIVNELNELSTAIKSELELEEPSLDTVQKYMNQRDVCIEQISQFKKEHSDLVLNNEEKTTLKTTLDTFVDINKNLQSAFQNLLKSQRGTLEKAMHHRKALKGYNLSKKPDISYY